MSLQERASQPWHKINRNLKVHLDATRFSIDRRAVHLARSPDDLVRSFEDERKSVATVHLVRMFNPRDRCCGKSWSDSRTTVEDSRRKGSQPRWSVKGQSIRKGEDGNEREKKLES